MADPITTKKTDPIKEALAAPPKELEKKRKTANEAKNEAEIALAEVEVEKAIVDKRIKKNTTAKAALSNVKESFNRVNRSGNFAAALATDVSGTNLAQSITDAAKSVKAALGSVDKAYTQALTMNGRVQKVEVVDTDPKTLVKNYFSHTEQAVDHTEVWKQSSENLAVDNSSFLKLTVDNNVADITNLTAKIEALGKDVDATIVDIQTALDEDESTSADLQTKIDEFNLAKIKNELVIQTSVEVIENKNTVSLPVPVESSSKKTSKSNN